MTVSTTQHLQSTVTLNSGHEMPMLGFGTWKIPDGQDVVRAVTHALDVGYRLIDTAKAYDNEAGVGEAIRAFGRREELFVTTKLWNEDHGSNAAEKAVDGSLRRLGLDYVDLFLIHWPCGMGFMDTWHAMERAVEAGKCRSIGLSNFQQDHLEKLLAECNIKPAVNQVEFHPWHTQPALHQFHREHGIQPQAWSPLMQGRFGEVAELAEIGRAHGKSSAQVLIRWDLQHGMATIPKASSKGHIEANAQVFDFALTDEQMARIDALDRGQRLGPDPYGFGVGG